MRALVLLLSASLAALTPAAAHGRTSRGDRDPWPELPARGGGGWPEAQREDFLARCRVREPERFCACWLELVEPRFPSQDAFFKALARNGREPVDHQTVACLRRHGRGR